MIKKSCIHRIILYFIQLHSCLCCSKMHYNLAALFRHYVSDHAGYSFINICLYDGLLFDDFESLESHVAMHESNKHARNVKVVKNEK